LLFEHDWSFLRTAADRLRFFGAAASSFFFLSSFFPEIESRKQD